MHKIPMYDLVKKFFDQANSIILDKDREMQLAFACFLSQGHLLIEDVPGVGKTTMVQLFAKLLDLDSSRIQFTNDILPGDILGNSIYDTNSSSFQFHKGPIFAQLVLGDELNRATPKTQSALLQVMEEREISLDGETYAMSDLFFVVATQNPRQQIGTFPLPESELDRFLMCIQFGYPSSKAEQELLLGEDRRRLMEAIKPVFNASSLKEMQKMASKVHASAAIAQYIHEILDASRSNRFDCQGLSPRAGIALIHSAKAWAWLQEREMVIPEDVQAVASSVIAHRLQGTNTGLDSGLRIAQEILQSIEVH